MSLVYYTSTGYLNYFRQSCPLCNCRFLDVNYILSYACLSLEGCLIYIIISGDVVVAVLTAQYSMTASCCRYNIIHTYPSRRKEGELPGFTLPRYLPNQQEQLLCGYYSRSQTGITGTWKCTDVRWSTNSAAWQRWAKSLGKGKV